MLASAAVPSQYAGKAFPSGAVEAAAEASRQASATGPGWGQTLLSLALVLGLVLALAWVYRRLSGQTGPTGGRAATVLGRSAVSPKHGVLLLKVGRRVLVCGESAGHPLTTLDSITDPDEVAELEGRLRSGRSDEPGFLTSLGQARNAFPSDTEMVTDAIPPAEHAEVPAALALERERPDEADPIEATRGEIAGLLEKVKAVSGQFKP